MARDFWRRVLTELTHESPAHHPGWAEAEDTLERVQYLAVALDDEGEAEIAARLRIALGEGHIE